MDKEKAVIKSGRSRFTLLVLPAADFPSIEATQWERSITLPQKALKELLEKTQRGNLDITNWLLWFMDCLNRTMEATEEMLSEVLLKTRFWENHRATPLNDRQRKMLNKVMNGFEGNLTATKWAKISKCSPDTALRDILDLIEKGVLKKDKAGGRSTSYLIRLDG